MFSLNEILVRYYTDCRQHATQVLNVILPRVFRQQRSLSQKIREIQIKIELLEQREQSSWLELPSRDKSQRS